MAAQSTGSGTGRTAATPLQRLRGFDTTAAIAVGGVLGALARYALSVLIPHGTHAFPWSTFLINAVGCALIGVLMALLLEAPKPHRLLRPFFGVGVLGGFTTFSTYAVDSLGLFRDGAAATGLAYLFGTLAAALVAVWLGAHLTRLVLHAYPRGPAERARNDHLKDHQDDHRPGTG
ncbi:fluoride efflux transporter CrcB [Actinopolymorpha pittospori]|uniref:Fluoride-specific ion channel FluC n=1 Tax=Actinopolymorpha pittospori TaxID=648752 RepID=A0A927N6P3_9ACTN|nr:fluoride efflux transporter CrcB [Actinopolymorpha pittospori]MBE1609490.1 CrcB protein [Actinopolymorpha pittospori]